MDSALTQTIPIPSLSLALLLHFVWQATLIVSLVMLIRSLVHPQLARMRYGLAITGLFAVLSAPLLTLAYYLCSPEAMASLCDPVVEGTTLTASTVSNTNIIEVYFQQVFNWFDHYRSFWLGGWLLGFVVLMARLFLGFGHSIQLRRRRGELPAHLQSVAMRIKEKLNLTRTVIVATSTEVTQAVATGILRPVVLIPAAWVSQMPVTAIEAVLAHELAHVKRWDLWMIVLQRLAETLFFFHPLVWWLSKTISLEREVCCDRLAIQATGQPMRYVETLAHVAEHSRNEFEFQFGNAFTGGKKMSLLRRAKMILEPSALDGYTPFRTLTLITFVGLVVAYGSYAYSVSPALAVAYTQDDDHGEHEVIIERIHGDHDGEGTIEVRVSDGNDSGRDDVTKQLHLHLTKLLHGNHSGAISSEELATHLRKLADHLDASHNQKAHKMHKKHRAKIKTREHGEHVIVEAHVDHDGEHKGTIKLRPKVVTEEIIGQDGKKRVIVEVQADDDGESKDRTKNKFFWRSADGSEEKVLLELKADAAAILQDEDGNRMVWRSDSKDKDNVFLKKGNNVFVLRDGDSKKKPAGVVVERLHKHLKQLHEHDAHVHDAHKHKKNELHVENSHRGKGDLRFGPAKSSDESVDDLIKELRKEVSQLRREVKQLRKRN